MKKIFILLMMVQTLLWAQKADSIPEFKNALQFQLGSNFNLTGFQGSTFSYLRHFSPNRALRIGLTTDAHNYGNSSLQESSDSTFSRFENDNEMIDFDLYLQYLFFNKSYANIRFFYGVGPVIGFQHSISEETREYTTDYYYNRYIHQKSEYWKVGISGICGVEWSVKPNLKLSAEYGINPYFYHTKVVYRREIEDDPEDISRDTSESDGFRFNNRAINIGISLFF